MSGGLKIKIRLDFLQLSIRIVFDAIFACSEKAEKKNEKCYRTELVGGFCLCVRCVYVCIQVSVDLLPSFLIVSHFGSSVLYVSYFRF